MCAVHWLEFVSEHHAEDRARVGADGKLLQTLAPTLKWFETDAVKVGEKLDRDFRLYGH